MTLIIKEKNISREGPPFIMAEIGVNHDGNPALAERLIEAAATAGADAVKFQLFDADLLLAGEAALVDYQKPTAADAQDLLKPLQLTPAQLAPLIKRAHTLNLAAIITPFSIDLVQPALDGGVDALKLASPDLVNLPLLEAAAKTHLPLILSTGAADMSEVLRTTQWLSDLHAESRTAILHCVSSYPTPPEAATLGAISALRLALPAYPIGYSDHTIETLTGALAVTSGACLLEKHLTYSRSAKGPDHAASLEPPQLAAYITLAHHAHQMRGPFQKSPQPAELQIRQQTRQSLVARQNIPAGATLTPAMLTIKRPGTGIPAYQLTQNLGKKTKHPIAANTVIKPEDLE